MKPDLDAVKLEVKAEPEIIVISDDEDEFPDPFLKLKDLPEIKSENDVKPETKSPVANACIPRVETSPFLERTSKLLEKTTLKSEEEIPLPENSSSVPERLTMFPQKSCLVRRDGERTFVPKKVHSLDHVESLFEFRIVHCKKTGKVTTSYKGFPRRYDLTPKPSTPLPGLIITDKVKKMAEESIAKIVARADEIYNQMISSPYEGCRSNVPGMRHVVVKTVSVIHPPTSHHLPSRSPAPGPRSAKRVRFLDEQIKGSAKRY